MCFNSVVKTVLEHEWFFSIDICLEDTSTKLFSRFMLDILSRNLTELKSGTIFVIAS